MKTLHSQPPTETTSHPHRHLLLAMQPQDATKVISSLSTLPGTALKRRMLITINPFTTFQSMSGLHHPHGRQLQTLPIHPNDGLRHISLPALKLRTHSAFNQLLFQLPKSPLVHLLRLKQSPLLLPIDHHRGLMKPFPE